MLLGRTLLLCTLLAPVACSKKVDAPAPTPDPAAGQGGLPGKISPIAIAKLQPLGGTPQAQAAGAGPALKPEERQKRCDEVMKHVESLAQKENPQQAAVYKQEHAQEVEYCVKNVPDTNLDCILKATTHAAARACLPAAN